MPGFCLAFAWFLLVGWSGMFKKMVPTYLLCFVFPANSLRSWGSKVPYRGFRLGSRCCCCLRFYVPHCSGHRFWSGLLICTCWISPGLLGFSHGLLKQILGCLHLASMVLGLLQGSDGGWFHPEAFHEYQQRLRGPHPSYESCWGRFHAWLEVPLPGRGCPNRLVLHSWLGWVAGGSNPYHGQGGGIRSGKFGQELLGGWENERCKHRRDQSTPGTWHPFQRRLLQNG